MDYKTSGVDIEAGYKSVELMKEYVKETMRAEVLGGLGGFSGAFSLAKIKEMEEPVLLSGRPAGPVAEAHFQHSFAGLYAVHHDADGMRHPDRLQHQSEPRDRRQQGLYRRTDRHAERAAAYFPAPERSWKRYAAVREL